MSRGPSGKGSIPRARSTENSRRSELKSSWTLSRCVRPGGGVPCAKASVFSRRTLPCGGMGCVNGLVRCVALLRFRDRLFEPADPCQRGRCVCLRARFTASTFRGPCSENRRLSSAAASPRVRIFPPSRSLLGYCRLCFPTSRVG